MSTPFKAQQQDVPTWLDLEHLAEILSGSGIRLGFGDR
jgi:hypothetical protein